MQRAWREAEDGGEGRTEAGRGGGDGRKRKGGGGGGVPQGASGLRAVWLFLLAALPPPQLRPREWARPRSNGPGRVARLQTKWGGCRRGVDTPYPAVLSLKAGRGVLVGG